MYYDVIEAGVIGELTLEVRFADGLVSWSDEIDLAPDSRYRAITQHGEWLLS